MKKTYNNLAEGIENYAFLILIFACFAVFTFSGIGMPLLIALSGMILCMSGLIEGEVHVDLWMLIPMIGFIAVCAYSSFTTFGNLSEGYTGIFAIYPVIYMLMNYLDETQSKLLRKLCILWGEVIAVQGIIITVYDCFHSTVFRLGGIIGNPNALGIFLAVIWLAVLRDRKESESEKVTTLDQWIHCFSPLILVAIALTLSMGSFLALAVGVLLFMIQEKKIDFALMAEMSIYAGTGILMFIAGRKIEYEFLILLPAAYAVILAFNSKDFMTFFKSHIQLSMGITAVGVLGGAITVILRPSAAATFSERLEMMRNGLGYFMAHPLTGVGSYQWRILNFYDSDKYFNTWHIHNVPIHIATELGIIAVVLLVVIFVRAAMKKENKNAVPALGAFVLHNLMDTSFFYLGVTSALLFTNRCITGKKMKLGNMTARVIYGIFFIYFVYCLLYSIGIIQ